MRVLVLGGTRFLGRHIVEVALARGHEITLFHRGETGIDLFEGSAERILGDRTNELGRLDGRHWDAAIDTCGYVPRIVRMTATRGIADRYLFVSSISVYDNPAPGADETWPVSTLADPTTGDLSGGAYGPLKALCEGEVRASFPETHLIARPGLIVGPHDSTDRFTYWLCRISQGEEVLAPDRKSQPVQFIDVRDLAEWCVGALESRHCGTFNVTGPPEPHSLGGLLESLRSQVNPTAQFVWCKPTFLEAEGVEPWSELPLYVGPDSADGGFMALSISRALATGLRLRPLEETVGDTLRWARTRPDAHAWKAGLNTEREAALLAQWHARTS